MTKYQALAMLNSIKLQHQDCCYKGICSCGAAVHNEILEKIIAGVKLWRIDHSDEADGQLPDCKCPACGSTARPGKVDGNNYQAVCIRCNHKDKLKNFHVSPQLSTVMQDEQGYIDPKIHIAPKAKILKRMPAS